MSVSDNLTVYDRDGFAVLRQLLPTGIVLAARAEYEKISDTAPTEFPADKREPVIVFWFHAEGGRKRYFSLRSLPAMTALVTHPSIMDVVTSICGGRVRLLETVLFNKPPNIGDTLAWHQDASFYPLGSGILCSALIPLDPMDEVNGTVSYAIGSHRSAAMSAVDLRSGRRLGTDERPVPANPQAAGYEVASPNLQPGDVTIFHSHVWHGSGPNRSLDRPRRLISIRYISLDTTYVPVPGNAATFIQQIESAIGEPISGGAFPIVGEGLRQ